MLQTLNETNVRAMLLYVADKIIESKPLLTEVDSAIGDGDHGIGMAGGMEKAKAKLLATEESGNAYAPFELAGKAMLMSMGGASGVIFGSMFMAGAKGQPPLAELDAPALAALLDKGLQAIQERGKAQVGDKTMVDALAPAVSAMHANEAKGLEEMLTAGENAAAQGVEDTKPLQAKFGRSKSLMERAIGHQDAGATSVWIILRSMREFVASAGETTS